MYAIALYNKHVGRVVAGLAAVTALSVFLYGALLLGAVSHAAGRTAAGTQVRSLNHAVSTLEGKFLADTQSLSPEKAAQLGFVAPVSVATVYAGQGTLTLR
jgi:hypothetical protein